MKSRLGEGGHPNDFSIPSTQYFSEGGKPVCNLLCLMPLTLATDPTTHPFLLSSKDRIKSKSVGIHRVTAAPFRKIACNSHRYIVFTFKVGNGGKIRLQLPIKLQPTGNKKRSRQDEGGILPTS
jgi:hypothetical protein